MTATQAPPTTLRGETTRAPRPARAVARITARLTRRGTIAISVGVGILLGLEAVAFESGYPDAASRAALTVWAQDPSIRIIAGPGSGVETIGGFAIWDAGLYLTLILGAWAVTMAARVLRGDEALGRTENLLVGPIRPARALSVQVLILLAACLTVGVVVSAALVLAGADAAGSVLYGAVIIGYCAALVGIVALASQVLGTRIGALGASASILAVLILLRMAGNSADSRAWLTWLTPGGWVDQARAFSDNRWAVLLIPIAVTTALLGAAAAIRRQRDTGAGLVAARQTHRSHRWGLSSPAAFAWRSNQGVLLAWAAGVAAAGLTVGALLPTVEDNLATDAGFQQILAAMGIDVVDVTRSFVGLWATILGLVIAVYSAFRVGSARAEEASSRVEFLLTRPLRRWRWLGGHVVCLVVSVVVLCATGATAMWLAGLATGARLTAADAFVSMFNVAPAVMVFAGLGVLAFGVVPRLTVAVGATAAVACFVIELVGPVLEWPAWVLGVSPFHHLAAVPVDPFGLPAAIAMTAIGIGLAVAGIAAFERRDLVGG